MKQKVNYINQHKNANIEMGKLKLNPTHISLYNALFLLWNNAGFPLELSINRNDVMLLSKIGSNNTYLKCLKELDKNGMIKYIPSYNPLIGSVVNLCIFDTGSDNVMTEFYTSTDTGSGIGSGIGIESGSAIIYKLINNQTSKLINNQTNKLLFKLYKKLEIIFNEQDLSKSKIDAVEVDNEVEENVYPTFKNFWETYDKKVGKEKAQKKWNTLKQSDKENIMTYVLDYIKSQPDKQFRKDPQTFFNNKSWEDEIIVRSDKNSTTKKVLGNRPPRQTQ
jgi:hypothetical protein